VRRILVCTVAALLLGGTTVAQGGGKLKPNPLLQDDKTTCNGDFGTAVKFVKTPSEAAKQALKEEKLVFVLHVSGEFEDPDFT
jgi:hypothetical protein